MSTRRTTRLPLSSAARIEVAGLVAGALGIGIQIASGVDSFPLIPPGAVLMLLGALVVALLPWRWAPLVGFAAAAWIGLGAVLTSEAGPRLAAPGDVGPFVGIVVQLVGVVVAVVAGAVATARALRMRRRWSTAPPASDGARSRA